MRGGKVHLVIAIRRAFERAPSASLWSSREPIREELFSVERLEEHGRSLAAAQPVTQRPAKGHPLATRVAENGAILLGAYRSIVKATEEASAITPAAEALIDNYYLVEKHIRELRSDLPPGFYRQLPKLADGPFEGYPRVFGVAWAFVAHGDSSFDVEMLVRYVRAYQEVEPLTIGELWAVSITLRIVLIENLRRLAEEIVGGRAARQKADDVADRLLGAAGLKPQSASTALAGYEDTSLSDSFAVQLVHRLRDQDPKVTPTLTWLDERLAAQETTVDTIVRDVHRRQGGTNVTVRNIVASLRRISDVDWKDLFERISLVDEALSVASSFREMDFPTRNLYRSAVEELARGSGRGELDIAKNALLAAQRASASCSTRIDERRADPGYYLLSGGRRDFEAAIGFRLPAREWPTRLNRAFGIGGYLIAIAVVAALVLGMALLAIAETGVYDARLILLGIVGVIPAIDASVAFVNRAVSLGFGATVVPALELRSGVPASLRTLVAIPTLLTSAEAVTEQIERLEIHHLASPEGDLHFALLSDWVDAESEHAEGDGDLAALAFSGIARLNQRYGPAPGGPRFLLLHRRRVWSKSEDKWIGWERKRGKLHELNQLLRGATDTTFMNVEGEAPLAPPNVRFVVTLDGDTRLPRDTVRRLIGKMAHPLNRPRFDSASGRVIEGYAVLQPRVTPSLPVGQDASLFQRIFSNSSGIDPYASATSDVYQDLFGEGSYTGKGIYEVDAFEAALAERVPESTLLSHDLFEGVFARAGLVSDVEVIEDFPTRYDVGARRHHRWARGDWQLLPWIVGRQPTIEGGIAGRGALPPIGRWKMLDNLRRTLSAPAAVIALLAGWATSFQTAAIWTVFVIATIVLPTLIPVFAAVPPSRREIAFGSHMRALGADVRNALALSALSITFLAHQAWMMGDAIVRTLWRVFVSRRRLLEWVPAAQTTISADLDLVGFYRWMVGALIVAAAALFVALHSETRAWTLVVPFAALWIGSPAAARWVSQPLRTASQPRASDSDVQALRLIARRTWRFFETFVTSADNMLPPDNYQEDPSATAHRTSPTNIGLYLLSIVSARDFGWIGTNEAVNRLEATLATMSRLKRFRGHFYNWYNTSDLSVLNPIYVSSVDSGNLAGHLIALANACREWQSSAPRPSARLSGVADALDLALEEATRLRAGRLTQTVTWRQLEESLGALISVLRATPSVDSDEPTRLLGEQMREAKIMVDIVRALAVEHDDQTCADLLFWAQASLDSIESHSRDFDQSAEAAASTRERLSVLEDAARGMALAMEFGFLIDPERNLLSVGFSVPDGGLDPNCYDLLASECRLASFFAIAKGDAPARHWFRLGRAVTPVAHGAALISWSGSMFEYLMPSLVMNEPRGSLLEQTSRLIVRCQIDYAAALRRPWGISEAAYNARDLELTYQYTNFGVPGLGLKRGLGESFVVAPYASALATMVDAPAACVNLARLAEAGALGRHGFYEALDYTPGRVPEGESFVIIRSFMAHHQGMTIVAIADALLDGAMRGRFHAEPIVQATELLLQERTPRDVAVVRTEAVEVKPGAKIRDALPSGGRQFTSTNQATPATHLLSNGRLATMITAAGSGYSRWGDIAVTRWREDATCDDFGAYIFLRDSDSGAVWSAGFQPSGAEPNEYDVVFHEDRAELSRRDGTLTTTLDVLVSAEDDAEVRRISISNSGSRAREIEITSYAELALAQQAQDISHPAFSKLFVETEYLTDVGAILAHRRRRAPDELQIWAAHLAVVEGEALGKPEIETDRARFLGRGHGVRTPIAMIDGRSLSNTVGAVLDPIFALRRRVRIAPGATARIAFWTVVASSREALLDGIDKHRDASAFGRAATLAWTQAQVQLHHLGVTARQADLFQRLAGHVLYASSTLRPSSDTIQRGGGAQSGLWAHGVSGDHPIVLLRIVDAEDIDVARELMQAHEYWRMKQLAVDLVILNERKSSYVQDLQVAIETLIRSSRSRTPIDMKGAPGNATVLRADLIPAETRALLIASARVALVAQRGSLFEQLKRIAEIKTPIAPSLSVRVPTKSKLKAQPITAPLEFFNGLGGFAKDGKEYVTVLGPGQSTPAPWINVVANPAFGFQTATEGSGYTWSVNSRENQLTPWSNDPVSDRSGEAFYLRDNDTGDLWSPTALPIRDPASTYTARHGRGYSRFEHVEHEIESDLLQFVPLDAPIKISRLTIRNRSNRIRHLSVTSYVEWVLGPFRSASLPFVTTEIDSETGAMFARNPWRAAFGSRVAFADLCGRQTDWTGDRNSFIGRNRTLASPLALASDVALSNKVGAGLDPCSAMRTSVEIAPNADIDVVFLLGETASANEARTLISRYRSADIGDLERDVARYWGEILGAIEVKTPIRQMDIMLNGWLLYQTLACRLWARSAFYQASGAYGFRDQLQDGTALAASQPVKTREHLLRAAARQFAEGDVQHWWLPHSGQGVRTRISDDRAWLAYSVGHYVTVSGDHEVLDELVPFLEGQKLEKDQRDSFFQPTVSDESVTLFEHCARALDQSLSLGAHGLPLIGDGDWNDGMNRVGEKGAGESVWLGWFLYNALTVFAPLAEARQEQVRVSVWRSHAAALRDSLEREAWDGDWYRRGFYDDGTPLGSAANEECRIDSIAQSWAALSNAAEPKRARRAMASVERELIRPEDGLALLFAPPFDKTLLDPGYIKGYPPGLRENGGQYTHAALWSVMAFAALGEGDKAAELFSLLNPINHARTRADVHRYKVEPYVVAADIYATAPHVGRGGWTWYTGSAGWMQRAGVESILGLRRQGLFLHLDPCIPTTWPGFDVMVRHYSAQYKIAVKNPAGVSRGIVSAQIDGKILTERPVRFPLSDDGIVHHVEVSLG